MKWVSGQVGFLIFFLEVLASAALTFGPSPERRRTRQLQRSR